MARGAVSLIKETARSDRLLSDNFAQHLVDETSVRLSTATNKVVDRAVSLLPARAQASGVSEEEMLSEAVIARTFDAAALNATQLGGVRQVVAVGHGGDTRCYRLEWPPGVRIFELAPFDAVAHAELVFARAGVKCAKGTLIRRVAADVSGPAAKGVGWAERLEQAGFSGNLPSIWTLQGMHLLSKDALAALLLEIGDCAALKSELVGEVDMSTVAQLGRALADAGFNLQQWATLHDVGDQLSRALGSDAQQRAVFSAEKTRMTGIQQSIWSAELERAEYEGGEVGFDDAP
jgi:methyltransferase (TIGR00027 family)